MQTAKQKEQLCLSDALWPDHIRIQINFKGNPVVEFLKRWFASPRLKPFEHTMYTNSQVKPVNRRGYPHDRMYRNSSTIYQSLLQSWKGGQARLRFLDYHGNIDY